MDDGLAEMADERLKGELQDKVQTEETGSRVCGDGTDVLEVESSVILRGSEISGEFVEALADLLK
jgi:hypothetical protein